MCPSRTLSRLLSRKRESSRTHRSTSSRHPPPLLGASGVLGFSSWDSLDCQAEEPEERDKECTRLAVTRESKKTQNPVPTMGSKIPHNKLSGFFILIFWWPRITCHIKSWDPTTKRLNEKNPSAYYGWWVLSGILHLFSHWFHRQAKERL